MPSGNIKHVNTCQFCLNPSGLFRLFKHPELGNIFWLSRPTCQQCIDKGKEEEYLKKELEKKCEECKEYNTLFGELRRLHNGINLDLEFKASNKIVKRIVELETSQIVREVLDRFYRTALNEEDNIGGCEFAGSNINCKFGQNNSYRCMYEPHYAVNMGKEDEEFKRLLQNMLFKYALRHERFDQDVQEIIDNSNMASVKTHLADYQRIDGAEAREIIVKAVKQRVEEYAKILKSK